MHVSSGAQTGAVEERDARLACHSAGQHGLARA